MLEDTLDVNEFVSIQCDGSLLPAKFEEKFYGSLYFISEGGRDYCRGSCGPTIGEWFSFSFFIKRGRSCYNCVRKFCTNL